MTPEDEISVGRWAAADPCLQPVVHLNAGQGAIDQLLKDFCHHLAQAVPNLKLVRDPEQAFCKPAIIIGPHTNIAYQAVPTGLELEPFLEALSAEGDDKRPPIDPRMDDLLGKLTQPVELELYIAAQCPFCPQVVRGLWPLAAVNPLIRLTIVDAALLEEQARDHGIRSVPLLIMDKRWRWPGLPDLHEVFKVCLKRDSSLISPASLRRIIEDGDAERAAALMITDGRIFPALISLLVDEKWSIRLGAMVTVEYLADSAPALAEQLIEPLWKAFGTYHHQVQGDVAHTLGMVGSAYAREILQKIVSGPFEQEVVQAAIEALEE